MSDWLYKMIKDHGPQWLVAPLIAVLTIQFTIWAAVSFVAWDPFFISLFVHRLLFVALCVFAWSALIADAIVRASDE